MEEHQIGWIAAIIIGGIAGWLAEQFMKSQMGLVMNIVLGKEELHRCFEEGRRLMRGYTDRDRVRPVADQRRDGTWEVHRVWFTRP